MQKDSLLNYIPEISEVKTHRIYIYAWKDRDKTKSFALYLKEAGLKVGKQNGGKGGGQARVVGDGDGDDGRGVLEKASRRKLEEASVSSIRR